MWSIYVSLSGGEIVKYCSSTYKLNSVTFNKFDEIIQEKFKLKKRLAKFEISLKDFRMLFSYLEYSDLTDFHYLYPEPLVTKKCIFCLKSEPEVTFINKPHVIPFALGNKYLLHHEECDQCNSIFCSTLEDALDKYTSVFRTLNRTKNRRNKINKITSIDGSFFYEFNKKLNVFQIGGSNYNDFVQDDGNGNLTISYDIKRHRPSDVYKAFMKIFYGLLPRNHHKKFTMLREWIMNNDHNYLIAKPLFAVRSWLPGFDHKPLSVFIYNKVVVDNDFDYVGLISFGNVCYEMPIFSDNFIKHANELIKKGEKLNFNLKLTPKLINPTTVERVDFTVTDFITDKFEIIFTYDSRLKNID